MRTVELLSEQPVLLDQPDALEGPVDDAEEVVPLQRLGQIVEGPLLHGLLGRVQGAMARHDDDQGGRIFAAKAADKRKAIRPRHAEIREHQIEALPPPLVESLLRRPSGLDFVVFGREDGAKDLALRRLIIHDQDLSFVHAVGTPMGSRIRTRVP